MSRPSNNTDRLLIEAAKKILPKNGATGINLRQIAKKAKVNLGMFHYHFKNKDNFIKAVLEDIYKDFYARFRSEQNINVRENPEKALENTLRMMTYFMRDNRKLMVSLIKDVLNGNKAVLNFISSNIFPHLAELIEILEDGKKRGTFKNMSVQVLLIFSAVGTVAPNFIREFLSRVLGSKEKKVFFDFDWMISNESIDERLALVLDAITMKQQKN